MVPSRIRLATFWVGVEWCSPGYIIFPYRVGGGSSKVGYARPGGFFSGNTHSFWRSGYVMTFLFAERVPKPAQFALCVLGGFLSGASLALDVALKWKAALIITMGFAAFLLMVRNTKRVLLFTLVFTSPFYIGKDFIVRTGHIGELNAVGLYLTDGLVVALLMLHLGRLAIDRQAKIRFFPSTTVPALAWLIASAFSLVNAREMDVAAIQMIAMGKLILLYFVVASNVEDEKDVKWLISGLLLGLLCQGLVGLYQGITGHPLGLSFLGESSSLVRQKLGPRPVHRAQGTIGFPNSYAIYLSATIPFALALLFSRARRLYKTMTGIVLCAGALGLVFSLSRGGWISSVMVSLVVLVLGVRRRRLEVRTTLLVAGATLLILLALTLVGSDLILSRLTSSDYGSARSRIVLARGALAIVQDYPLSGVGLNNYALFMPHYDWASFQAWNEPAIVHNLFLLIAAETGFIGLVAFLWFLASVLIQAWRLISRAPNDTLWMAGVGIFCAYISLSVHSMVDYALIGDIRLFTQFWLLAGMAAGLTLNSGVCLCRRSHMS